MPRRASALVTADATHAGAPRRRRTPRARTGGGVNLVIVESPAKARTIAQYLGADFVVESSVGHVRDLPSNASEIPARYKGEAWARTGVDVDHDFKPLYIVPAAKRQTVARLKEAAAHASTLYLATDEDREGEAIAWHLREVLQPTVPVHRMVFHEITRAAIEEALQHPREIDEEMVEAQEARRILDRLYGYEISPVLWRKVRPRLSAGRVQSAALRLVVDRERARMRFRSAGYWDIEATLEAAGAERGVLARLIELGGRRVVSGRDFDAESGALKADGSGVLLDGRAAEAVAEQLRPATFVVVELVERPYTQRPPAPFTTSTLQQEAGRKLRYTAQRTMQAAQSLYEHGYITYMRTDSTNLSQQAIDAAREQVRALYGEAYLPPAPRHYATRSRGAQEAHEAIRPAGDRFRIPESLRRELEGDRYRLYELVWQRTVASQMRDAAGMRTNVRLEADAGEHGRAAFAASGKVIAFPGFLRAYVEGSDDPDAELEDQERLLPPLAQDQRLNATSVQPRGHETQPPARFTEASLVRELEERGIGRPSTYASIIQTILSRDYAWKKGAALVPTFVAFAVVQLLERHFPELVNPDFTARMEDRLDSIALGDLDATPWLHEFYFGGGEGAVAEDEGRAGLQARIAAGWEAIDARAVCSIPIGVTPEGETVAVRVGRYGPYLQAGDGDQRAPVPEDTAPDELTLERALELLRTAMRGDDALGADPASGLPVLLKSGRYGPYAQLGPDDANAGKPRRASLWPGMSADALTLEQALLLLSFPKSLGVHPQHGVEVTVQDGPNGPYLRMGTETRSLRDHEHLRTVDLEQAVALLAQPKQPRRAAAATAIATLGAHPRSGEPVRVLKGRFGPYVTDGVVNASLPAGSDPAALTLDDAVALLDAREQRLREQGKDPRAPRAPRRARAATRSRSPRANPPPKASRPRKRSA
ncbi:MAG: type I DNA topoisomerase [Dehalococcoidia bacterium]|nr:type I DNA topoisomerase [Dehalococcoidia bacterium]